MKRLLLLIITLMIGGVAIAGDYHQEDSTHMVIYTVVDTSGNHVTGETIRLTLRSQDSVNYYDFSNNTYHQSNYQ